MSHAGSQIAQLQIFRSTVSSISYLPNELLSYILILSLPIEDWSLQRLQQLALVCRSWKAVVHGVPELWSTINCCSLEENQEGRKKLALVLKKSKNLPLAVLYRNHHGHPLHRRAGKRAS